MAGEDLSDYVPGGGGERGVRRLVVGKLDKRDG
jgi:hypothetical protein